MTIKQSLNLLPVVIFAIALAACGGSSDKGATSVTVKPKTTTIKGDLGDYFVVVDHDYQIKVDGSSGLISVEVKRTDKDFDFPTDKVNPFGTNGGEDYHAGFGIEIFSDAGPQVIKQATEGGMGGPYSSEDVTGLMKLKKGETGYIRWSVDKLDGLQSFQLSSALAKSEHSAYSGSSDETISTENGSAFSETGSENWDELLDDYGKYVDEYVKFYKKAMKGDQSAMAEYPSLMEKATSLQVSIAKAQNDNKLSATQVARMMKIQTKLLQAAAGN